MNILDILGIKKAILQAFEDVMVKFSFWISRMVYPLIADFYEIFDVLARHRFFTDETIRKISNNIYILISVIMIFAFSIKLINSIVNPDVLTDKKKGFTGLFIRAIIGVLLIVLIPWAFQLAYEVQDKVLDKAVVQKIVLGEQTPVAASGGDLIAGATLKTFLHSDENREKMHEQLESIPEAIETLNKAFETNEVDDVEVSTLPGETFTTCPAGYTFGDMKNILEYNNNGMDESILTEKNRKLLNQLEASGSGDVFIQDCVVQVYVAYLYSETSGVDTEELTNIYSNFGSGPCLQRYNVITGDISTIDSFKDCITIRDDDDNYIFEYNGILGPIAGIFMAYEMLLLCIDIALRSIKLGLLELIAPVIICGYIYSGEIMKKWVKEVVATYILVFVKLAVVSFLILGMTLLPDFISNSDFADHALLIKLLIIIGLLQLVKQLPNLINSIFGIEIKSSGGIKGRLGEMAGIGKMAQDAWSKLGGKAKGLGKTLALAPVGAAGSAIKKGWNRLAEANNPAGNFAARVNQAMHDKTGRVLRTLKAGVNSNGKGTAKALTEAWNKDAVSQSAKEAARLERSKRRNERNNMNAAGTGTKFNNDALNAPFDANQEFIDKNNNKISKSIIDAMTKRDDETDDEFKARKYAKQVELNKLIAKARIEYDQGKNKQLEADVKGIIRDVDMNSGISSDGKRFFNDFANKIRDKEQIDAAKSNQDKMISILETARNNAMDPEKRKAIENMIGAVKSNGFYNKSVNDQLAEFDKFRGDIDQGSFNKLKEFTVKFNSQTAGLDAKGATAIAQVVSTRTKEAENATKVLDAYKDNLTSDSTKAEIDEYKNMINVKTKEMVGNNADIAYFAGEDAIKTVYGNNDSFFKFDNQLSGVNEGSRQQVIDKFMNGYNHSGDTANVNYKGETEGLKTLYTKLEDFSTTTTTTTNPLNSPGSSTDININPSNSSDIDDLNDNIMDLMSEVQSMNEELKNTKSEIKETQDKIDEGFDNNMNFNWTSEGSALQNQLDQLNGKVEELNKKIDEKTTESSDDSDKE